MHEALYRLQIGGSNNYETSINKEMVTSYYPNLQMETTVLQLHKYPQYLQNCCDLINSEWKRSNTARLRSLESSCDTLPVSLVLLKDNQLIGHLKLSAIPSIKEGCFVESVVIDKQLRGQGFGSVLMRHAEEYCRNVLGLTVVYLSTKGQEGFYSKLGYVECQPISIYGGYTLKESIVSETKKVTKSDTPLIVNNAPKAPPMPGIPNGNLTSIKTYMKKYI